MLAAALNLSWQINSKHPAQASLGDLHKHQPMLTGSAPCTSLPPCVLCTAAAPHQTSSQTSYHVCCHNASCTLQQQVEGLAKRKAELQAEDQKPLLGHEDQRAALLAQIKADNEACEMAAQKSKQATELIRQLERQGVSASFSAQPARYGTGVQHNNNQQQQHQQQQAC